MSQLVPPHLPSHPHFVLRHQQPWLTEQLLNTLVAQQETPLRLFNFFLCILLKHPSILKNSGALLEASG